MMFISLIGKSCENAIFALSFFIFLPYFPNIKIFSGQNSCKKKEFLKNMILTIEIFSQI